MASAEQYRMDEFVCNDVELRKLGVGAERLFISPEPRIEYDGYTRVVISLWNAPGANGPEGSSRGEVWLPIGPVSDLTATYFGIEVVGEDDSHVGWWDLAAVTELVVQPRYCRHHSCELYSRPPLDGGPGRNVYG